MNKTTAMWLIGLGVAIYLAQQQLSATQGQQQTNVTAAGTLGFGGGLLLALVLL